MRGVLSYTCIFPQPEPALHRNDHTSPIAIKELRVLVAMMEDNACSILIVLTTKQNNDEIVMIMNIVCLTNKKDTAIKPHSKLHL